MSEKFCTSSTITISHQWNGGTQNFACPAWNGPTQPPFDSWRFFPTLDQRPFTHTTFFLYISMHFSMQWLLLHLLASCCPEKAATRAGSCNNLGNSPKSIWVAMWLGGGALLVFSFDASASTEDAATSSWPSQRVDKFATFPSKEPRQEIEKLSVYKQSLNPQQKGPRLVSLKAKVGSLNEKVVCPSVSRENRFVFSIYFLETIQHGGGFHRRHPLTSCFMLNLLQWEWKLNP